jgi:hypothetical protein
MSFDVRAVREHFPALKAGYAHFDGPGGSQVPDVVATAVSTTLLMPLANRGRVTAAERTADGVVLAIGANLAMGLLLALVYARYAEPRLHGPNWWRGMQFALVPWLLSLVVFLPLMGGGVLGMDVGAGPLPIIGNLILHLVYGAVLGISFAEASEDWLDDTDVDRGNAAAAEQGAAVGLVAGLVPGLVVGWLIAPAFDDLVGRPATAIGVAFIGAAIGLAIGSFVGMGRAERPTQGPPVRH